MQNNNVTIGPTTIVGWATALLALMPTIIKSLEEGSVALNGPEKYLAIAGIAAGLVTQIGRYLQSHKLIGLENSNSTFMTFNNIPSNVVTDPTTIPVDTKDTPNVARATVQ